MKRLLLTIWLLIGWSALAIVIGGGWMLAGALRADPFLTVLSAVILAACLVACCMGVQGIYERTADEEHGQ